MFAMIAIVALALLLMWRVYLHHTQAGDADDEPGVVAAAKVTLNIA